MLSYTQTRLRIPFLAYSLKILQKKKKEKVKASDIFLESQSRNGIFHRILMNASQIVKRRSDDAFSSSLFDELCDDSVEKFVIGDLSNDDRS